MLPLGLTLLLLALAIFIKELSIAVNVLLHRDLLLRLPQVELAQLLIAPAGAVVDVAKRAPLC